MKEGEFKKRIPKIEDNWGEGYVRDKAVLEIINEAKKEAPPLRFQDWIMKQPEWINPDKHIDLHDMWQRYAFEWITWFKKWLGEDNL